MPDLVEVSIDSVRVSLMSPQRIVILKDKNAERFLPIWVGPFEAEAITVALQEVEVARPMTHDLLRTVFATFNAVLVRVEILALKEDIYFGNIVAEAGKRTVNIDSRASDAIALAVRAHIPIMVHPEVMETAAIVPETDLQAQMPRGSSEISAPGGEPPAPPTSAPLPSASPEEAGRLSIFDQYLDNLPPSESSAEKDGEDKPSPET